MARKREKLLKMHPYSIGHSEARGFYYTYLPDSTRASGRKQVRRKNREELVDLIIETIKAGQLVTFRDLYEEFVKRKLDRGDIKKATATRYQQVFDRHFLHDGWDRKDIRNVTPEELSDWIEDEASRCNLSAKALSALTGILKGIIQRARKKKLIAYTASDVFADVDVRLKKVYKKPEEQTFSQKELPMLIQYLVNHIDVHNLCLLFMLLSGVRVGEMVGLMFDDFTSDTSAEIRRSETKYKNEVGKWIYELDTPKTNAGYRTVFIPQEYGWIVRRLRLLSPDSDYLCFSKGKRLHTASIRNRLYGICDKLGINRKSTHKLRKTFCSIVLDAGFDKNLVISIMGHTDVSISENFYHFDRKSAEQKQKMLDNIVEFKAV